MRLYAFVAAAALLPASLAAHADSFIYSGSIEFASSSPFASGDSTFTTGPVAVVSSSNDSVSATGNAGPGQAFSVTLDDSANGGFIIYGTRGGDGSNASFTLSQYMTPGTYAVNLPQFQEVDTLTVTDISTTATAPEISASGSLSGLCLLCGAVLITREQKRLRS